MNDAWQTLFMFRDPVTPGSRFWEGLRLSAAFVGMDHIPVIVFMDEAVRALLPNALPFQILRDYLKTTADLAGIYVLDISLEDLKFRDRDLDPTLNVKVITLDEISEKAAECKVVAIF
jgi:sulfur relay (sulfurtransferase) DsrF/TusC family protein